MLFARFILAVQALVMAALGLAYWLYPYEMANLNGMLLMEPASVSNLRVYYGGLQLGLGLFLLWSMYRPERLRSALVLLLVIQTALALARLVALLQDGDALPAFDLSSLVFRLVMVVLGAIALLQLPEPAPHRYRPDPLEESPAPLQRTQAERLSQSE
jgi:hypothetical protein